jgi:hypothetical protein
VQKSYIGIDLFAGAGGLSFGARISPISGASIGCLRVNPAMEAGISLKLWAWKKLSH